VHCTISDYFFGNRPHGGMHVEDQAVAKARDVGNLST
jgi:hypothetical protein